MLFSPQLGPRTEKAGPRLPCWWHPFNGVASGDAVSIKLPPKGAIATIEALQPLYLAKATSLDDPFTRVKMGLMPRPDELKRMMKEAERQAITEPLPVLPPFFDYERQRSIERERERNFQIETARLAARAAEEERERFQSEQAAKATLAATEPVQAVSAKETKEQRQDRRLQMCIDAGLTMPKTHIGRMPNGIGEVAKREDVSRQSFTEEVRAAIQRKTERERPKPQLVSTKR